MYCRKYLCISICFYHKGQIDKLPTMVCLVEEYGNPNLAKQTYPLLQDKL